MKKFLVLFIILNSCLNLIAQEQKKQLKLISTDFTVHNEYEVPGAVILTGNVQFEHDGANIYGNKVYFFQKEQYIKVFGNVRVIQGDSVNIAGNYGEYNGIDKLAFIADKVNLRSKESTLVTDTIFYNRNTQQAYYNSNGVINSGQNVLKSKRGTYDVNTKKFIFRTNVEVINPDSKIETNHLDYYEKSGHAYVFGPSWINNSNGDRLYTENGYYDTKNDIGRIGKNAKIYYDNKLIEADKLDYNRNKNYAKAQNNIKITDTINKMIVSGHFAEVFRDKDSMYITKKALVKTLVEKDTMYLHGKQIVVTGKVGERVARAYNNVRFFKSDMSGKCDSLHSDQTTGITKLINKPVVWSNGSQITGTEIQLLTDSTKTYMDSLKVINNAFLIQKDTIGNGFNQMKGINLYGKFKDNKLNIIDLIKNTESIYYIYNKEILEGIEKTVSSKIRLILDNNKIKSITRYTKPDGQIYPESELPENVRLLRGFLWRGDEEIKTLEEIFPPEELLEDEKAKKETLKLKISEEKPMEVLKETLDMNQTTKPTSVKNKK